MISSIFTCQRKGSIDRDLSVVTNVNENYLNSYLSAVDTISSSYITKNKISTFVSNSTMSSYVNNTISNCISDIVSYRTNVYELILSKLGILSGEIPFTVTIPALADAVKEIIIIGNNLHILDHTEKLNGSVIKSNTLNINCPEQYAFWVPSCNRYAETSHEIHLTISATVTYDGNDISVHNDMYSIRTITIEHPITLPMLID